MPDHNALVFTTDPGTRHGREMLENPTVSGGIVLETKVVGKIRGVQSTGKTKRLGDEETRDQRPETERQGDQETRDQRPETVRLGDQETKRLITHHSSLVTYLKRFPYAVATKLDLWVLEMEYVKMTDNRLGFGTKLEWRRETLRRETREQKPKD